MIIKKKDPHRDMDFKNLKGEKGMRKMKKLTSIISMILIMAMFATLSIDADAAKKKKTTTTTTSTQDFATASSAKLLDGNTIAFQSVLPSAPASDDGILYLYQLQPYEYSITAASQLIATSAITTNPSYTFALNHKQPTTRLYSKFVLCVKRAGVMTMITYPQYITNPEVLATHTHNRIAHGKKALQGVDFMNLYIYSNNEVHPRLLSRVAQVTNNGMNQAVTNPYSRAGIIPQDPRPNAATYYMMNAAEKTGIDLLASKMEYYAAEAYKTDDWIIGNEVNVRQWNYMIWVSWDEYLRQYEQVFRVCYNAIKSNNANAQVYVCIDQNWNRDRATSHPEYYQFIDGKDFLTLFATNVKHGGDIDWGVAQHPYTVPLFYAKFWDMSGTKDGAYMANMINTDKMVSFQNLGAITSFLATPGMLNPKGQVRHFMLSEVGICNAQGADVQAAALCTSYVAAATNPYVEQIIYSNANHGTFDSTLIGSAVDMFNNMDGANAQSYYNYALGIMGKTSFAQVIR